MVDEKPAELESLEWDANDEECDGDLPQGATDEPQAYDQNRHCDLPCNQSIMGRMSYDILTALKAFW